MRHSGLSQTNRGLVSQEDAARIQRTNVQRSTFHNRWTRKTAFDAGHLVPILVHEVLPGDHLRLNVTAYVRMATPLFPLFDGQRIDTFFFFCPNRLVWDNWAKLMGEQENPGDSTNYTVPLVEMTAGGGPVGSLEDHMGIPVLGQIAPATVLRVNAMPFRMYHLIYNSWFRDQNLENSMPVAKGNGPDAIASYALMYRAKMHDYFTSALPWPQKFTAPVAPIGGNAPIRGLGFWANSTTAELGALGAAETGGVVTNYTTHRAAFQNTPGAQIGYVAVRTASGYPSVYADLAATGAGVGLNINQLRTAWSIQDLLEKDARGGTRYTEKIREHFGVINPDFRLQRPEYIGGGSSHLNITPIAQTAPNSDDTGLGALGAAGTAAGTHSASYAATEHGFVIGLINVRTELSYQQGLHKMWQRQTQYDYYFPSLAGLGEQYVYTSEIYCTGDPANDNTVFGYQERWQEYRTKYSDVTGIMRSTAANTIDQWHLAQNFLSAPVLSGTFIDDRPPMERVLAAGLLATSQQYLADISYEMTTVRPIPVHGMPVSLGRF